MRGLSGNISEYLDQKPIFRKVIRISNYSFEMLALPNCIVLIPSTKDSVERFKSNWPSMIIFAPSWWPPPHNCPTDKKPHGAKEPQASATCRRAILKKNVFLGGRIGFFCESSRLWVSGSVISLDVQDMWPINVTVLPLILHMVSASILSKTSVRSPRKLVFFII